MAAPFALDNLPDQLPRTFGGYIEEDGAGTYNYDVFVPAGALILDIIVHNEVLWAAGTSAAMNVGDYASAANTNGDAPVIGSAIDADGFFAAINLKATDLLAGESVNFTQSGGKAGAYNIGTNTHWGERFSLVDRWIRFSAASVGAGTTGRTACAVVMAMPAWETITQ